MHNLAAANEIVRAPLAWAWYAQQTNLTDQLTETQFYDAQSI